MCGIAGIFGLRPDVPIDGAVVRAMAQLLRHRGPDGEGVHHGPGFALAHRRLAIVDLATGQQPMSTADGDLHVTFNGEIYNHLELRAELEAAGFRFRTHSDTEVLLHGFRQWGTGLPARLRGMFAFALVDVRRHLLFAARDRLGKKPLHWLQQGERIAFASEIKALHATSFDRRLRADAVAQFLALRYVPEPASVFAAVHKLPAAHWLLVQDGTLRTERYWRLSFTDTDRSPVAEQQAAVLARLDEAVRVRLMSEVPLQPFLSGGIDSYAVVESMTRSATGAVRACTIGFDDPAYDERPAARAAAAACGVPLREEVLRVEDLLDLDWHADTYDEPFADSSAVPTFHVCRLARREATVALSGDGGDEAFAGYRRYLFDVRENRWRRTLPAAVWRGLGRLYPKADWLPRPLRAKRTLENLACDPATAYARSVSATLPAVVLAVLRPEHHAAAGNPLQPVIDAYHRAEATSPLHRATSADLDTWLVSDILVKVDRASMATSLEVRAPFLDHHLLERAARVPADWQLAGGVTKAFLRTALAGRLQPAALQRRKQGFSVPLRTWLRGPVGVALAAELDDAALGEWIDPRPVQLLLQQHRAGLADHAELLWAVLVFARFLRRWCA